MKNSVVVESIILKVSYITELGTLSMINLLSLIFDLSSHIGSKFEHLFLLTYVRYIEYN